MAGTFELGLTITSRGGQAAAADVAAVQKATVDLQTATSQGTQVLLDKYDQQGAALRRLKADYLDLQAEMKAGFVSSADADRAVGVLAQIEQQMGSLASATDKSAFSTANARRELIVMGHEAMTGNFSRMPGSFMVLAERVGMTTALFNPFTLGIVAAGAAVVGFAVAIEKGHDEMVAMDNALAVTSDYAGLTRGGMESLAASMASSGQVTVGTAKDIVTALVASGRIGADSIGAVAQLAANYAEATGQDVSKIAPQLIKLFEDPLKGAEQLNQSMHFLTAADIEQIATLERLGEVQQAQLLLAQKLTAQMPDQVNNIGNIEGAWRRVKNEISGVIDAMIAVGKDPTIEQQIALEKIRVENLSVSNGVGRANTPAELAQAKEILASLQAQEQAAKSLAATNAQQAADIDRQNDAQKEIDKSATHQLTVLQQQLTLIASAPDSADKARREFEVKKQIADLQNSMSADARVAQDGEINNALKMQEITLGMAASENDARLKLGTVTQAQHDATKTFLDLEKNQVETIAAEQLAAVAGLTSAQKQQYANRLAQLAGEKAAIEQSGATQQLIDEKAATDASAKSWADMEAAIAKASQTELSSLDKAIKAQQAHNDEIGKTPAQIEAVKAAITDQAMAEEQASADAIDAMLARQQGDADWVALSPQVIAVYQQISASLHAQVADQQKLSALQQDGSVLAANAAAAKAAAADWQKGWKETDRIVRDTFVSWATQGGSMAQKIGDALKQALVSAIYEAELKPIALQLYTSATGALGMSGSPVGSATGLVNTASNAYSLYGGLTGGVGTGLYGTFAASGVGQALGLSSVASFVGPQAAGAAAAGTASVGLTGAGAAIGTAMPYVAAAIAAYELFAKKGGGPQQGQYGSLSGTGAYTAYSTMSGGDSLGNQALSAGIMSQIAAIAAAAGKSAADITVAQGYKMDPQGTAQSIAYRQISIAGLQISGKSSGGDFTNPGMADYYTSHNDATGVATYLGTLHTPEIQALVTALGDPKLIAASNALMAQYGELEKSLPTYLNAQAMQQAMSTSMMTNAEKLKQTTDQMDAGFAALGLSVPKSTEDFRALINGIDLTTTAGQNELAALNQLGPAFLQVAQATGTATTAAVTAVRSAADIANERQQLQDQLDNLTMTNAQLLQKQRDALDASNQALFDQVQAATAAAQAGQDAVASMQQVVQALDAVQTFHLGLGDAIQSIRSQMPGYDASSYYGSQITDLGAQLAAATGTQQQLDLAAKLKDAITGNYNAEMTALQSEQAAQQQVYNAQLQSVTQIHDALLKIGDYAQSLLTSDLSPLSSQEQLQAAASQYQNVLSAARGGDATALGNLSGAADSYLKQARSYYASSQDYTNIFGGVQGALASLGASAGSYDPAAVTAAWQTQSLALSQKQADLQQSAINELTGLDAQTTTWTDSLNNQLAEQAIGFANLNLSTQQIADNTKNLDQRIADAIARALAAQAAAQAAINAAQTAEVVSAIKSSAAATGNAVGEQIAATTTR